MRIMEVCLLCYFAYFFFVITDFASGRERQRRSCMDVTPFRHHFQILKVHLFSYHSRDDLLNMHDITKIQCNLTFKKNLLNIDNN